MPSLVLAFVGVFQQNETTDSHRYHLNAAPYLSPINDILSGEILTMSEPQRSTQVIHGNISVVCYGPRYLEAKQYINNMPHSVETTGNVRNLLSFGQHIDFFVIRS